MFLSRFNRSPRREAALGALPLTAFVAAVTAFAPAAPAVSLKEPGKPVSAPVGDGQFVDRPVDPADQMRDVLEWLYPYLAPYGPLGALGPLGPLGPLGRLGPLGPLGPQSPGAPRVSA